MKYKKQKRRIKADFVSEISAKTGEMFLQVFFFRVVPTVGSVSVDFRRGERNQIISVLMQLHPILADLVQAINPEPSIYLFYLSWLLTQASQLAIYLARFLSSQLSILPDIYLSRYVSASYRIYRTLSVYFRCSVM